MPKMPVFINVLFSHLDTRIDRIASLGVGIELYAENNLIEEITTAEMRRISDRLRERRIPCSVHAPFMDLSPGGFDNKVRSITREKLKRAVEMAQILDAKVVVCHPGYDKWRFGNNQTMWLDASVETWTAVLSEARGGPAIVLENVFEETPDTFIALFDNFKGEDLYFCLDTGHFNMFSVVPLDGWLIPLKSRLRELHLHDNHGNSDEHLPVGRGTFPFRELKPFLKERGNMIFTTEVHGEAYALEAIQRLQEFLS
jgi:sugar phosphate isomerase/epimerase